MPASASYGSSWSHNAGYEVPAAAPDAFQSNLYSIPDANEMYYPGNHTLPW